MSEPSPFWTFSLRFYRTQGIPPVCIELQDSCGVDVNVLLFGLWLASRGRALSLSDLRQADAAVAEWRAAAVVALRGVRRYLREPPAHFAGPDAQALRERVKAVELEAERLQQQALFALRPAEQWGEPAEPLAAARANLDACAALVGRPFPAPAVETLLSAFSGVVAAA